MMIKIQPKDYRSTSTLMLIYLCQNPKMTIGKRQSQKIKTTLMTQNKKPKYFLTPTILCDNIGSTRDGMLPVSYQEQAVLVPYPRAMGSLIQS